MSSLLDRAAVMTYRMPIKLTVTISATCAHSPPIVKFIHSKKARHPDTLSSMSQARASVILTLSSSLATPLFKNRIARATTPSSLCPTAAKAPGSKYEWPGFHTSCSSSHSSRSITNALLSARRHVHAPPEAFQVPLEPSILTILTDARRPSSTPAQVSHLAAPDATQSM